MKKRKISLAVLIILLILAAIVSCENKFVIDILPVRTPIKTDTPNLPGVYTIIFDKSGDETGDVISASPDSGKEGNTVTLSYTVANTAHYNLLNLGGVTEEIASVESAGSGTRTYTINAEDASNGIITITAVFTHTNLIPDNIEFSDTEGHINKTYGGAFTNAVAEGYSGNGVITYSSSNTTVATVDNYGQVTIHKVGSAIITAEKAADAVYAHAQTNYTLTVNPKPVTIIGLSVDDKFIDGTTAATVITNSAVIEGLIDGDEVIIVEGTAEFEDTSLGDDKTVTFSGWSLDGADADNYLLTAQPKSVTASITNLVIDQIAFNTEGRITKTYGDAAFTNAVTSAHKGSGAVSYSSSDTSVASVNSSGQVTIRKAGTVIITAEKKADAVYAYSQRNYTLTVNPKSVTITGLSAGNKVYDGTTTAPITGSPSLSGVISGDTVIVNGGSASFSDALAGRGKTVTFSGWSLVGTDAGNYILSAQPASVTANIIISPIEMVQISSGSFSMGSHPLFILAGNGEKDEGPQHTVTLSGFYMGKYEVTQEQYQAVMGTNPSYFKSARSGESGTPGKLPVEEVSWYDSLVFCNKLSMAEGLSPAYSINGSTDPAAWGTVPTMSAPSNNNATWNAVIIVAGSNGYRLPTEAQWEYACRAGTTTAYNTGATISDNTGWYTSNSGSTHKVGLKNANSWGLYDMHGNVCEWCWDLYGSYSSGAQTNPMGASSGFYRVFRGGSWFNSAEILRSAIRLQREPYWGNFNLGLRLVRPL